MPPDSRSVGGREPADLIVEALLGRFLPLARTRIETAQASDGQYLWLADPAYDQVLDSLAMVAAHTPQPLIKALTKWRQSESSRGNDSPKGGSVGALHQVQRKLAVECVFTSACARFAECCPLGGVSDDVWVGLEEFVFDWLLNADRCVPHSDYPSLLDLRSLLLDCTAQLAGALAQKRFASVTNRFFVELDSRASDTPSSRYEGGGGGQRFIPVLDLFLKTSLGPEPKRVDSVAARSELLHLLHGMRFLKLQMSTSSALLASRTFLIKANPLSRAPSKKKTELQHTLCTMLATILAPLTEMPRGQWPPPGLAGGEALNAWNAAVLQLRAQVVSWMEKQSTLTLQMDKQARHLAVAYPLVTILLCLGDEKSFHNSFLPYLEMLYKQLREKSHRGVALDCLHRLLHFYLNVYAASHSKRDVWEVLQSITRQLMASLKKGALGADMQHDRIVDFCVTIAGTNLDFAMNEIVLELLKTPGLGEAKVIGLRALLAVVHSCVQADGDGTKSTRLAQHVGRRSVGSLDFGRMGVGGPGEVPIMAPHLEKVRGALGNIIKLCHSTFGQMLLIAAKPNPEPMSKERQQGWQVFRGALRCVPHLIPEQWRNDRMTEIIPVYAISIDPGVREEAVQVLFRTVRDLPHSRFPILRGMANFILRIPDDYPLLIQTSLTRLVQLLQAWRGCAAQEAAAASPLFLSRSRSRPRPVFDAHGMDAVGLIFLCSTDKQIRRTALDLLKSVRALQHDLAAHAQEGEEGEGEGWEGGEALDSTFVIDVFEETGNDAVQGGYFDRGRWQELRGCNAVDPGVSLQSVVEGEDTGRWARCLGELLKFTAEICPQAVQGARLEVVARMAGMVPTEGAGKGSLGALESESKLEQWQLYATFACACPPEDAADGGLQSIKELLHSVLPVPKSGHEAALRATVAALGAAHAEICEAMLTELSAWVEEVGAEMDSRKWKGRLRKEDLKVFGTNIYRTLAQTLWPGVIRSRPWLRQQYVRFVNDSAQVVVQATGEAFGEAQVLRFGLATVMQCLGMEMVTAAGDKFDVKWRKRLFYLFATWSDDPHSPAASEECREYWREVERLKAAVGSRTKDPLERGVLEREVAEQAEAIEWMALEAMTRLSYGPCFDENVKKMMGRLVVWINALMEGSDSPSHLHLHQPPYVGTGGGSVKKRGGGGTMGSKERGRKGAEERMQRRAALGREALTNLMHSNLDILEACIEQCYSESASLANSYFTVVAGVYMRHECPSCPTQRLLSLILYKAVDTARAIRDDALQMLETLAQREWADDKGQYRATVVGSLPDSYQQFQYQLSARLAKEHPELSELLCEEILQRQLDAVDIIAQHQVLTCLTPWMENLNLLALWETGWSERLLKSLYYVTWRHGDQFPDEIERLWSTLAAKSRNIIPILDFLISKGIEDCDSNASGEIGGALVTFLSVAKRVSLYLARISPQQTIDHLVYELSQKLLEEDVYVGVHDTSQTSDNVLEFSQGGHLPRDSPSSLTPPHPSSATPSDMPGGHCRSNSGGGFLPSWTRSASMSAHHPSKLSALAAQMTRSHTMHMQWGGRPMADGGDGLGGEGGGEGAAEGTPTPKTRSRTSSPQLGGGGQVPHPFQLARQALTRADFGLIFLAEIAYENDEDFRGHLPLLFHVIFVCADSVDPILLEHAQQLLVNLLYTLAGRHLELHEGREQGEGEYKQQVVSLMAYVQSKKGSLMWETEDMSLSQTKLPSAALLSSLVLSVVNAIFFQGDLRERWGEEALKWSLECASRHMAGRSMQIFRALRPAVTPDKCVALLRCLHRCLSHPSPPVLGAVQELLLTMQVMVEGMAAEKMILYPQMFWGCVALLHTDLVHVYTHALLLLGKVAERLNFGDATAENVLLSSMPSPGEEGEGVQLLLLKGLLSSASHGAAIEVLSRLTPLTCDRILGPAATRLLLHCVGLLPWMCLQLERPSATELMAGPGALSPTQQQLAAARVVAGNLMHCCHQQGLQDLAAIFAAYSEGRILTPEDLLNKVAPRIAAEWFPDHADCALGLLLALLDKGPLEYQRPVLLLLRALLMHAQVKAGQSPHLYASVSRLVDNPSCRQEAESALEAILNNCSSSMQRSKSSGQNPKTGSRTFSPDGFLDLLPTREVARRNTEAALGRVLATYGNDEKVREVGRLVPFVDSLGNEVESPRGSEPTPRGGLAAPILLKPVS